MIIELNDDEVLFKGRILQTEELDQSSIVDQLINNAREIGDGIGRKIEETKIKDHIVEGTKKIVDIGSDVINATNETLQSIKVI